MELFARGDAGLWHERAFQPCAQFWRWVLRLAFASTRRRTFEEVAKLGSFDGDQWSSRISAVVVARSRKRPLLEAADPVGAARVTEDLDYRIAQRSGSVDGWRSFLSVHGGGVHAQTATGEVERLLLSEQASAQRTGKVSNETSLGVKAANDTVRPATLLSGTKVAALTPDSGVGSLGHEPPVTAADVPYGASSDAKAESEACNPPRLARRCRSQPLRPTKTVSLIGTV